ncbi:tape measure protein [Cronobacter sakazakii]|nr:tape measure protein [Cronobacter sakazakii]EIX6183736.1 tape measure protein [Cronobacter sakazakii]EIX6203783.1 tape measure protein [Cronobacter sakazakii]EIX6250577.1 tape measure protein [Cronobacter sakazakii]EIX6259818.1 tape measure protein [Cronobacter sakazakii]
MAGTFDAGSVVYEVDMDTSRLLAARREVDAALNGLNGSMGRLEASVNRTERSIGSMERTMSSLSGVAKGLLAALSVQQVASYADAWTELNNKVANSVRTGETQAEVMQRIFDVSQATQSSLNGTATLYARLERGTRTYNTSAEDLTRLTTIINQGFAVSGATAQEAENATIQLSQGIASGVLRGEEFNSVSEQGSRLMVALADSMGVSIGQLRAMAAQGQLTTDVVVKGLLSQGDAIGKEFANTTVSIAKGLQVAGNNVTKFFGENSTVKSFAAGFRDSVITISENLETLGTALIGAAAIMGGRFAGALAMATAAQASRVKATIQGIVATRQSAQQEAAAASVTARKAVADKDAALSALNLATAEYNVAKGSAAEAFALENVIRLRGIYVATSAEAALANNALAASQAKVAATGITFANTMKVVNSVTAPLGGPIGVIAIVAAGWYLYSQRQAEARKEAIAFADTVPDVIKRLKDMNLAQAQGVRADTVTSIEAQKEAISDLKDTISGLQSDYEKYTTLARQYGVTEDQNNGFVIKARDAANELAKKRRDLDGATATLKQTEDALHLINIQVNQGIVDQMRAARDNAIAIAEAEKQASFLGGTQAFLAEKLGQSTQALKAFNSESLKINWGGKEGEKLIKQAERRLALSELEGEAKARRQAAYDAEDAGVTDDRAIKRLQDNYAATERNTQARKDQKKEDNAAASEAKKLANQQESVAQKLANLKQQAKLAAGSTQELSREQAMLNAELSLGKGATQSQIQQARQYAATKWDTANAIKAQAAAEKLLPEARENASYKQDVQDLNTALAAKKITQEQYNQTIERLEANHQATLAKIRAQAVVSPQQEAVAQVNPVQQLANENAQKLALIKQFEQQSLLSHQQAMELRNATDMQYEQQRINAQWEIYRNQSEINQLAASAIDSLQGGATNAITGLVNGTQNLQEAFANIGTTILGSVVGGLVEMGIQWVKSQIMGQAAAAASLASTMAQATAAASAWAPAAISASIATYGSAAAVGQTAYAGSLLAAKGMAVAGAREHGGPVSANSMYRVGEGGKPEIYQANNGSQYMIPGDNGRVISNRDMQKGGSDGGVVVQQTNHYHFEGNPNSPDTIRQFEKVAYNAALRAISNEQRPNGLLNKGK